MDTNTLSPDQERRLGNTQQRGYANGTARILPYDTSDDEAKVGVINHPKMFGRRHDGSPIRHKKADGTTESGFPIETTEQLEALAKRITFRKDEHGRLLGLRQEQSRFGREYVIDCELALGEDKPLTLTIVARMAILFAAGAVAVAPAPVLESRNPEYRAAAQNAPSTLDELFAGSKSAATVTPSADPLGSID